MNLLDPNDRALAVERLRIGDRLAAFSVLLPARPSGAVLLAVTAPVAAALAIRYPNATVFDPAVPPAEQSVGLLVLDEAIALPAVLRPALTDDAVIATLGPSGTYSIYPELHHPQQVWRRGWPIPAMVGTVADAKRVAGLWGGVRRNVPKLTVEGPAFDSLADLIRRELEQVLGEELQLVGVVAAGHTVLRFRGRRDIAVRLSWTDVDGDVLRCSAIASQVPAIARLVPEEVARGRTCGYPWAATLWVPQHRRPVLDSWQQAARSWAVAERLAAGLQTVRTGRTAPGWARNWCAQAVLVPEDLAEPLVAALAPLEHGLPTGWSHGDPWPGNVLLDGRRATVIDWDNSTPDAPLGLDWLLIAALRLVGPDVCMAAACAQLVDETVLVRQPVAGRRWPDWSRELRVALALAAFLLYLRNRALHDLGEVNLDSNLAAALALAASTAPEEDALLPWESDGVEDEVEDDTARGATGGAMWMGASAAISKGAQTVVLLALAALLAPSALGLLAVGALIVNVCSAVTDLGSSTALVYWRGDVERAARSALSVALAISAAITGLCWVTAPWLSGALRSDGHGTEVIRGLTIVLPCYAVAGVSAELLRRTLAFRRRVLPDIAGALAGAAVSLLLAFSGYGVMSLVVGQIVQAGLSMVLFWLVRRPVRPGWRIADVRGLLGYGGHIAGANVVQLLLLNVDYLIVARVLGPGDLGQYSLAFRLAYMPFVNVAVVFAGAAFPYLCRLRGPAVGAAAGQVAARTMTVVVPLYLGMALFAPQLELLGDKWAPAVPVVRWLAGYGVLLSLVQLCQTPLSAVGRPRDTLVLRVLHLVALAALLLGIARLGIVAVAIGQLAAAAVVLAVAAVLVARQLPGVELRRLARSLLPCALGCAAMVLVVVALQHSLTLPRVSFAALCGAGGLAVAVYGGTVWLTHRRGGLVLAGVRA